MALGISEPVANLDSASDGTSFSFGAFTPSANALLAVIVSLAGSNTNVATASGGSLTWTKQARATYNGVEGGAGANEVYLFTAPTGSSPGSTTITIDCTGDSATGCMATCFEITGTATLGLVQVKTATGGHLTAPSITMDSALNTNNAYIGGGGGGTAAPTVTPPSSWTETADFANTDFEGHFSAYRVNGETGTTYSWTGDQGYGWGIVLAEFSEGGGGSAAIPVFMNQYRQRWQ